MLIDFPVTAAIRLVQANEGWTIAVHHAEFKYYGGVVIHKLRTTKTKAALLATRVFRAGSIDTQYWDTFEQYHLGECKASGTSTYDGVR